MGKESEDLEINSSWTTNNTLGNAVLHVSVKQPTMNPRICIIGHKRHGKDDAAKHLSNAAGLRYLGSSEASMELFLLPLMKEEYGVNTIEEAMDLKNDDSRSDVRAFMYDRICEYNLHDPAKLAKGIMSLADIYVGMRSNREMQECLKLGLFDLVIWIDASNRMPEESSESFNISRDYADIIVDNNGPKIELYHKMTRLGKMIKRLAL